MNKGNNLVQNGPMFDKGKSCIFAQNWLKLDKITRGKPCILVENLMSWDKITRGQALNVFFFWGGAWIQWREDNE